MEKNQDYYTKYTRIQRQPTMQKGFHHGMGQQTRRIDNKNKRDATFVTEEKVGGGEKTT